MNEHLPEVYLARHGETAWSISGQHTGRTDVPLTDRGERNALSLGTRLKGREFASVLVSPMMRARRTCELAGFAAQGQLEPGLMEWDYGRYEGLRTAEIRKQRPDWYLFRDGCPGGESLEQVGHRADQVIARFKTIGGPVLCFSHSHILRVIAARWVRLAPGEAAHFVLSTAALSILGYEHGLDDPAILLWNDDRHVVS
jgi:probable phosphoglycerate mutase